MAFTEPGDVQNATLPLSPLGDYGGRTDTQLPEPGSQALDNIPDADCHVPWDQRGVTRPQGVNCDSGSVERHPGDSMIKTYLPLILRDDQ